MGLKWVFFDIDNTLFNSKELAEQARKNAIRAMIDAGLPAKSVNLAYRKLMKIVNKYSSNYPHHFNKLIEEYNVRKNKSQIVAAGVVAYHDTKFAYLKPFPDVVPTLLKLSKKYKLGIITNGRAVKQWDKLIRLGLQHFFDMVIISEEVGFKKPDLRIFEIAIKKAKCKPSEAVMIGDREDDMAAKEIGMKTINIKKLEKFDKVLKAVEKIGN